MLIDITDIQAITGLSDSSLLSLIKYAEAQAKQLLGFLEQEDRSEEFYIFEPTKELRLSVYPINSVSLIEYTTSSASGSTTITEYRLIKSKGIIILDSQIPEEAVVTVTYNVGWTADNVPNLVKVLLAVLVINHWYSLYPEQKSTSKVIVSEKIGDYVVKYTGFVKGGMYKSLDEWVEYLVERIQNGPYYQTVV